MKELTFPEQDLFDTGAGIDRYMDGLPAMVAPRKPSDVFMFPMTPLTRKTMEEHYAKLERKRKALRERKRYTRKRGTVHPKKKEATRRRLRKKMWAANPFGCILMKYGCKAMDRDKWDVLVAPLWQRYEPEQLSIKWYTKAGSRAYPHTIYNMDVLHATEGRVYCGSSQELYDLSVPVVLDMPCIVSH